jgi:hypothetical protein
MQKKPLKTSKNPSSNPRSLGSAYSGPSSTNPGVLKAKEDKKIADKNLKTYKNKTMASKK